MNNLKLLTRSSVSLLTGKASDANLANENIQKYSSYSNPFLNELEQYEFFDTQLKPIEEKFLDSSNDFITAKYLFETLKIDRIQASDSRLWITLTHRDSWSYMQKRWNLKDSDKGTNLNNKILSRWHLDGSPRNALARNGLSRLWWAAELTYAPWEKDSELECFRCEDPYKYTKIISENKKSQALFDVLDREFGGSPLFRICYLEAFSILVDQRGLAPTIASAKLSVLFNALLIPRSVSAHKESPENLLERILNLQKYIPNKKIENDTI